MLLAPNKLESYRQIPKVENPQEVKLLTSPPSWAKEKRLRGRKAQGMVFERAFHKYLKKILSSNSFQLLHNPWFSYQEQVEGDAKQGDAKLSFCQPDFILEDLDWGLVIETKTTRNLDGIKQLLSLYRPIIKAWKPEKNWTFCLCYRAYAGDFTEDWYPFSKVRDVISFAAGTDKTGSYTELFFTGG